MSGSTRDLSKFLSAYRKGYSCKSVLLHLIADCEPCFVYKAILFFREIQKMVL